MKEAEQHPGFNWSGIDHNKHTQQGTIQAANAEMAKAMLRKQGISPKKITALRVKKPISISYKNRQRLAVADIVHFTNQLATLLRAGVDLHQCFSIISAGQTKQAMSTMLQAIQQDLNSGLSMADALQKYPQHFNPLYIQLIKVGEVTGQLEALLFRLASYLEKKLWIQKRLRGALLYPAAILTVALIVTVIMLIWVIPQFAQLFAEFDSELPALTALIIQFSALMSHYGLWLLGGSGILFLGVVYCYKHSVFLPLFCDQLILKTPLLGSFINQGCQAQFSKTLHTLLQAGVPLLEALPTLAGSCSNRIYQRAILGCRLALENGQSLSHALIDTQLFSTLTTQLLAIGEETGTTDDMAAKLAAIYEQQIDDTVARFDQLLEPFIMVIIGLLVGGLILAMYLPLLQLGSAI